MAAWGYLSDIMVVILEISYLGWMLAYPIIAIQWIGSRALSATYLMLFTVSIFLKLTSFHHVCYDNRYLMRRVKQTKKPEQAVQDLATLFNVNERTFSIAMQYPNNLDLRHYLRFLLAVCYFLLFLGVATCVEPPTGDNVFFLDIVVVLFFLAGLIKIIAALGCCCCCLV